MIYSYCKRCRLESPGDTCAGCGKRSTAAAQRDIWSVANVPLSDGRLWRGALYTLLGVSALLFAVILGLEALLRDAASAQRLLQGGLPRLIAALAAMGLALVFLFLALQGREVNVYVLDPQGAHLQTWHTPQKWKSWARLQSADPEKNVPQPDGSVMHLSQERHLMWRDVQSVRYQPDRAAIYVYHTPHCAPLILKLPAGEFDLAAAYVGKYCKGK